MKEVKTMFTHNRHVEFGDENEGNFSEAIRKLSKWGSIQKIIDLASTKLDCTLSLCVSNLKSDRSTICFILYRKEQPGLFSIAELSTDIQEIIDYENVLIQPASLFSKETLSKHFKAITPLNENNKFSIELFFKTNYLNILQKKIENVRKSSFHKKVSSDITLGVFWNKKSQYEPVLKMKAQKPLLKVEKLLSMQFNCPQ